MRTVGLGMLGIGALAIAGFGVAVAKAAEFEQQLSRFSAITNTSKNDMEALREKALQLGRDSAYGATEVIQAFVELGKAGLTAKDILAGLGDAVVTLAAAGELPIADSAKILVNTLRQFNIDASESVHVADLLAGAANASTIEVQDLGVALSYVGPVAAIAGISLGSTTEAIAILGNAGLKASTIGTSLRGMLVSIVGPSAKAKGVMKELGIITEDGGNQFFTAEGKVKSFAEISQVLQNALQGLNKEQKLSALHSIFQRRAMNAAGILARAGTKDFEAMRKEIGNTTAHDVMEKKLDNLSGQFKILKASLETFLIRAGSPVQNTLKNFVKGLISLVNWFAKLNPTILTFITWGLLIVGIVFSITGAIALFMSMGLKAIKVVKDIGLAFKLMGQIMNIASLGLLTNPIFLIIAALVLLGVALFILYKKNEAFRDFVDNAWQTIQDVFWKAWAKIKPVLKQLGEWLEKLKPIVKQVVDWIKDNWETLVIIFAALGSPIAAIVLFIQYFKEIKQAVKDVVDFVRANWPRLLGLFLLPFAPIIAAILIFTNNWEKAWKIIGPVVKTAAGLIKKYIELIIQYVQFLWDGFGEIIIGAVVDAFEFVVTYLKSIGNIIKNVVQAFLNIIEGDWGEAWDNIKEILQSVWDIILGYLQLQWDLLIGLWQAFLTSIQLAWEALWILIKTVLGIAWDAIIAGVQWGVEQVLNFFKNLPGWIMDALSALAGLLYDVGTNALQALWDAAVSVWNGLYDWLTGLPSAMADAVGSVISLFYNIGYDIVSGLWNGISDLWGNFISWLWGKIKDLPGILLDFLGIGSPSKMFMWIGQMMMVGLQNGIGGALSGVSKALQAVNSEVASVVGEIQGNWADIQNMAASANVSLGQGGLRVSAAAGGVGAANVTVGANGVEASVQPAQGGDFTYNNYARDVNPDEIVNEYVWAKRLGRV